MKIGIIGAGWLGGTVGRAWLKAGHEVLFSSRNPSKQQRAVAGLGPLASGGSVQQAAAFGEVVLISVSYRALEAVGRELKAALSGKIVLDACIRTRPTGGTHPPNRGCGMLAATLSPPATLAPPGDSNGLGLASGLTWARPTFASPLAFPDRPNRDIGRRKRQPNGKAHSWKERA